MTTIDELGRQAGAEARADATRVANARVESGLEQLRLDVPIVVAPHRRVDRRRWIALGSAAALSAAAIVALVLNANEQSERRIVPIGTVTDATTAPTLGATTTVADTQPAITSKTPDVISADAIAVSHDALPPVFPATVLVGMTDQTQSPLVAIGDTHIVTVAGSTATLIDPFDPSAAPQTVQLDVTTTGSIAVGPGDVLYAVVQGDGADMSLDAIPLSGARAGQVVLSTSVAAVEFAEAPVGVLGHGSAGIIDRRTGDTLLSYVDETGKSISLDRASHQVVVAADAANSDLSIKDPDGANDWHLSIGRDP